jgi:hypothetical protein
MTVIQIDCRYEGPAGAHVRIMLAPMEHVDCCPHTRTPAHPHTREKTRSRSQQNSMHQLVNLNAFAIFCIKWQGEW